MIRFLIGQFSWSPPPWLSGINNYRKAHPLLFGLGVALLLSAVVGYLYYQTLPKPLYIQVTITPPALTTNVENPRPDTLKVEFNYDVGSLQAEQPRPAGLPSVARIDLVGNKIPQGIHLKPAMPGAWTWKDDRHLEFSPEKDWPAGVKYTISFDKRIFVEEANFKRLSYTFHTHSFNIDISKLEFYQDPRETSIRRVIGTLLFSHPVNTGNLEKHLSLTMRPSGAAVDASAKTYAFRVNYDQNHREAYVQSEPISLPSQTNYMNLTVAAGVHSVFGGSGLEKTITDKVLIPDIYNFLKISQATTEIVPNQKLQPEQVLMLGFTDYITEQGLLDKLTVYLLPEKNKRRNSKYWGGPREVTETVLKDSQAVELKLIPNEKSFSKGYNLVLDVPEGRFLYAHIKPGLTSINKFVKRSLYDTVLSVPAYPKEVRIMGDGSVLTFSGEHQLSMLARGLKSLKISVAKVLPGQVHHLVSQTGGNIKDPHFANRQFSAENISEVQEQLIDLKPSHPKQANYTSIDLSAYLPNNGSQFGLFFIEVKGWDKQHNREIYGISDKRLVMVTDLGVLVKNNADQSHEVFVQSIRTGKPVKNTAVELLGRNGIALFNKTTSSEGHVSFPSTKDFTEEKKPNVYIVKTHNDVSFIPFDGHSRQINFSKFDVSGVRPTDPESNRLTAYIFTDRGIYRPSEKVNIGVIVKNKDLGTVERIPLELVIRGPRRNETKVSKLTLPEKGIFDFKYNTEATSDTGTYKVDLYLVRDNRYRGRMIGSGQFKVAEFQPDTLKIESKLIGVSPQGWTSLKTVQASVALQNLFGTPAQDRKVLGKISVRPTTFKFADYAEYTFIDPFQGKAKKTLTLEEELKPKNTNADGIAVFDIALDRFTQGTYAFEFDAEGFEQGGGRSVFAHTSMLLSPLPYLVGYKGNGKLDYINIESNRTIDLIALNSDLEKEQKLNLTTRLIEIQHVSTLVKQKNGTYQYQTVDREQEIQTGSLDIEKNGISYVLPTTRPGDFALEIVGPAKIILSRIPFSIIGQANLAGKLENNAELQLKLDKADYKAGEMIEMNIKAPYVGSGLITIETDKVQAYQWFSTATESTLESIRIPDDLEGNAYVNVSFLRAAHSKEVFTSPLSYAVAPFTIDRSKRQVDVVLAVDKIVRPGTEVAIKYHTSKPAKVVVFAVDEGILQVVGYKTPDPLGYFLRKRALAVTTLQILDLILPDFDWSNNGSAPGGGKGRMKAIAKNLNPFSRKTDKPAVFWSGIVEGNVQDKTVSFVVPDTFSGTLRIMAVAVSAEAMGVATNSTLVRGPFVISPNVLTQAAPGDEFLVTAGIANGVEDSGKDAKVVVTAEASEHLEIIGNTKTELKISEGDEAQATFKVRAKNQLGAAKLRFTAELANETSSRTVSLSVRPVMPYHSSFDSGYEQDGSIQLPVQRSLYSDLAQQKISASASPLVLVDGLSSYLEHFPHGCTEQVVSKVFPLVGLMTHPGFEPHSDKTQAKFSYLMDKLRERQLSNGGFSFWPGGRSVAEFPSVYVMHFLIESRDLGYPVPVDMIQRGEDFLNNIVAKDPTSLETARIKAHAIYLLTRRGQVTTNYLVNLQTLLTKVYEKEWKGDLAAVYMAATYQLLQKQNTADGLVDYYALGARQGEQSGDFDSALTHDAQYIYLLSKHFQDRAKGSDGKLLLTLINPIFRGDYNTISSAYSILALGAFSQLKLNDSFSEIIRFKLINGMGQAIPLDTQHSPFSNALYAITARHVTVESDRSLYYLNSQSGFDHSLPTTSVRKGLEISRDYIDADGKVLHKFEQGKEITVRLRVRALNKPVTNVALVDLLPGGFEVVTKSVPRTAYNWRADYVDVREDRVVFYGTFDTSIRELKYQVKLTAAGIFVVPPAFAEAMYDRSVKASTVPDRFEVTVAE